MHEAATMGTGPYLTVHDPVDACLKLLSMMSVLRDLEGVPVHRGYTTAHPIPHGYGFMGDTSKQYWKGQKPEYLETYDEIHTKSFMDNLRTNGAAIDQHPIEISRLVWHVAPRQPFALFDPTPTIVPFDPNNYGLTSRVINDS
jgi:hypothetical protein